MSAECYDELYAHDEVTVQAGNALDVASRDQYLLLRSLTF